jgi:pimeloyl-ACP methyl ester carboxylesterase
LRIFAAKMHLCFVAAGGATNKEKNMARQRSFVVSLFTTVIALIAGCALPAGHSAEAPAFQSGYAPVNGLKMYYEIYGSAANGNPPLVLLHGGGSTIETSFGKILPGLAKNRQVIAVEQQGHGHTADVDRPFTFEQSAEDTVALLRYLKIEKADFMGYSNGGHIALEIALKHPEVVRKLVFESIMFSREGSDPAFWESFKHAKLEDMPMELREAYLKTAPHPEDLPVFFAKSVERMRDFKGWTPQEVRSIKAPALVIMGDRDVASPEHAVLMFRLLRDAQLAILPDTDHMMIVKRSDWLLPMIAVFLDSPMPQARLK